MIIINNKLFKNIGVYGIASIIEKAIPFFCLPVFTRLLNLDEIGLYILYISIYGLILPLSKIGLDNLIMINFYKIQHKLFKVFVVKASLIYLIWFSLFLLLSIFIGPTIMGLLSLPEDILYLSLASSFPYYFVLLRLNLLRARMRAKSFAKLCISISFFKYSLAVLVIYFFPSWIYIAYSTIFINFIAAVYSLYFLFKEDNYKLNVIFNNIKVIILESLAILTHQLNTWLGGAFSRVIITSKINLEATGGFGIAGTYNTIVSIFNESIDRAYVPKLFDSLKNSKIMKSRIVKFSYLYYIILIIFSFVVSFVGYHSVGIVFGHEYVKYSIFIPFLVFSAMFNGLYKVHVAYVFYCKKLKYVTLISFLSNFISIVLIFVLIDAYALLGVAIALMIGQIIAYILAFYFGNKFIKMPWFRT